MDNGPNVTAAAARLAQLAPSLYPSSSLSQYPQGDQSDHSPSTAHSFSTHEIVSLLSPSQGFPPNSASRPMVLRKNRGQGRTYSDVQGRFIQYTVCGGNLLRKFVNVFLRVTLDSRASCITAHTGLWNPQKIFILVNLSLTA